MMIANSLFQRKYRWTVNVQTNDGDLVVPENFAKVVSVSAQSAFEGLFIRICCGKQEARKWEALLPDGHQVYATRYDGCGMVVEKWLVKDAEISNVFVEETITEEMDQDPSCPFGDFLHFTVKGLFKRLEQGSST